MRLFQGSAATFLDVTHANELVEGMVDAFQTHMGKAPGAGEVRSWSNSLPRLAGAVQLAGLHLQEVLLEYRLAKKSERLTSVLEQ